MRDGAPAQSTRARVRPFGASQPTHVVVAAGIVERAASYASTYGTRFLVVTGEAHVRASGVLERMLADFHGAGLEVELLEGVGPNPTVAVVDAGAALCRARRIDAIVALGGGSVVDAAKAIATSAAAPEHLSFTTYLSGLRSPDLVVAAALPVVAIPTLPGSGSETNGTSVITDDDSGRKLSAHSELAAPRVALLDPELPLGAPGSLLAPGFADAACHALEAALADSATVASDALAEQALRMLLRLGRLPVDSATMTRDEHATALTQAWWATNLAGQALSLSGSLLTHPLAHPISARLDVRHGEAVAALEPAVIATFAPQLAAQGSIQKVGRWLDVRGASDGDAAVRGVLLRLQWYLVTLGVRAGVAALGLVEDEAVSLVVRDARASGSRGLRSIGGSEPSPDLLFATLDLARRCPPDTPVRQLLDVRDELRGSGPTGPA
ncbi:MAG: iron-containing alcohol dehydrogenase [Thermoleophilia bacterium]|nr:iron-containing alcohol dehydrogenase [Thermoleophilia bacterium]